MQIIRSKEFTADRPWGVLGIATKRDIHRIAVRKAKCSL